nr:acyltransferase domain-containing protein [Microcystis aeruginosa LG13-12]
MKSFTCLSLNPISLEPPGIALATAKAGGVGILDLELLPKGDFTQGMVNFEKLLSLTKEGDCIGLRLCIDQIVGYKLMLEKLVNRQHWLILADWNVRTLAEAMASLPKSTSRTLLLEVLDTTQIDGLKEPQVNGLIAKGNEAAGWVGEDATFILLQKLLASQSLPVYAQGGIGIHTAAGCRAAGAAGVVLDDQLWLMPNSPLPEKIKNHLKNLNGQEAISIGERLGKSCRVLSRPGLKAVTALQKLAEDIEIAQEDSPERRENWQNQAQPLIGWGDTETVAPPMGQAVGLAVKFQKNYRTIGRLIQAIYKNSAEQVQTAQDLKPLQPDSPLARSHGTKYPIMQGPMTRVSDVAEFANAVSSAGGLPMLALALMKGTQVKTLLEKARQLMSDRAWGVGILGFVPSKLKEEQLAVVKQIKPPFALIAGGRPDQAAQLEAEGIATYIHVPTPTLLKMFLEQGAKRFVFEGRECGGHVGPLSSFILWESMIDTLLQHRFSGTESDIHLFFAGGIHDHISAAMVAAMAAPLAARGMKIGVLMGTAYILTQEAVECGAIVPEFQQQILKCDRTINLETGPGHASRCAVTPFAQEFYETRRKMMVEGASPEEIKDTLEDLTLGRLRLASKGLMRDEQGQVITLDAETQVRDGMYMIGQVATLHDQAYTLEELHENVSLASTELLTSIDITEVGTLSNQPTPSDIAIVGVATLLPKAQSGREYWENIINKVDAITEIPQDRWDWRLYFHQDRRTRDKIYSKWGGFLEDVPFDPMGFGIPPKSLKSIEPMQLLALETVRQALVDAGYEDQNFDREHTSVILGCGGGIGDLGQQYATRSEIPRMVGENAPDETWDRLPEWTEESFPGVLLNVVAGRIASRFDFGGSNFTVDAACASSLAAIELAVKELETGRANVAIAGGVDTVQSPFAYFCFSKTQALSPRGKCHTFDQSADGIVISEGLAMVVLKRLADAERDGDHIYAVIKAVAGSSDGKALGLTAPLPSGQKRAVKRAAAKSGINPSTWSLYEAHGTGTVAGDRAELETLMQTLAAENAAGKSVVLGSVKTMIGHTKSSAGVAGLIKVALALHHKVLPPHRNVDKPLEPITQPDSPVYLLKEARPWLANPAHPRRGAVSAFGFGGTNFHAVLEEYQGNFVETDLGAPSWSHELLIFRAANREGLIKEIKNLQTALEAAAEPRLADLAYSYAKLATIKKNQPYCLAIVTTCLKQLQTDLVIALDMIAGKQISPGNAIAIGDNAATKQAPIAFLFSGQGSQYPQMMREIALYLPEMREFLEFADQQLQETLPKPLSQYIYPPSAYSEAEENTQVEELKNTKIAQPAIGTIQLGLIKILARLNLAASMTAGHSYGEYTALCAAGVVKEADFLQLSALRGQVMADACQHTDGAMAAVQMNREELSQRLKEFSGVLIANHNAPMQSVISGDREIVVKAVSTLNAEGIRATMLPVSGAFHTPLVVAANQPLTEAIAQTKFARPRIPVYGNATGQHYHPDPKVIKNQLEKHLVSKVEFVQEIEKMYADGARVFIEIGPKNFLSKFTRQILENHEHLAVALDDYGGGLKGLLRSLATLIINGVDLNLTGLFAGRTVQQLDLSRLIETQKPVISKTTWLVNGGSSRPQTESVGYMGKIPPLNQESMALARKTQVNLDGEVKTAPVVVNGTTIPEPRKNGHPKTPPITATPTKSPATSKNLPVQELATRKEVKSLPSMPKESNYPENNLVVSQSGISGQEALLGYQAYQETMRQFLKLEEKVMQQFLMDQVVEQKTNDIVGKQPQPAFKQQNPSNISVPTAVKPFVPVATRQPIAIPQRQTPATAVIPVPVVKPEVVKQEAQSKLERAELIQILVELVSDRTGYPGEMLGLDQDLEAELGIDSIKRVEILGALAKI